MQYHDTMTSELIFFMITHKYSLWTQRRDLYVKAGGKYSNHCALIGETNKLTQYFL
jgi:hypothetical protein